MNLVCAFTAVLSLCSDDMGLGKTLQCITLLWTMLKQGMYGGRPEVKRAIIVTPGSLVKVGYLCAGVLFPLSPGLANYTKSSHPSSYTPLLRTCTSPLIPSDANLSCYRTGVGSSRSGWVVRG